MNFNTYSSHRKTTLKREMAVTKTILLMIGIVITVSVIVSDIWRLKVCWPHYLTIAIMSFFVLIWKITRKILSVNEKQLVKQVNKYKTDVTIIINKKVPVLPRWRFQLIFSLVPFLDITFKDRHATSTQHQYYKWRGNSMFRRMPTMYRSLHLSFMFNIFRASVTSSLLAYSLDRCIYISISFSVSVNKA